MITIVHKTDMPAPTPQAPWAQVEWIFDQRAELAKSKGAKDNFRTGKSHFIKFLASTCGNSAAKSGYWVDQEFDAYTLLRFKQYIDDHTFSSSHKATILSAARTTIQTAITNRWIRLQTYIDFSIPPQRRETDARAPYTEAETAAIVRALNNDIRFARKLLRPYVRTELGRAPQIQPNGHIERTWWNDEDNLRWYFENVLQCQPITGCDPAVKKEHRAFLSNATNKHGGLHRLYRRWGVSAWIGPEVIAPYACKLIALTGLNPYTALSLDVDAYRAEHPLTGRPYIRYWKERGSGENEAHLDLLSTDVLTLNESQNRDIQRIWEEVSALTAPFREELPDDIRTRLFVYQSRSVKVTGIARDFIKDAKTIHDWATAFVQRHKLTDSHGSPLKLTLARFRPSLVSRMIKRGIDIFVVKSLLGHSSILTTLRYIDSYDFAPTARREIYNALVQIRENRRQQEEKPRPVADMRVKGSDVVFATGIALCKDVFSPPANIRKGGNITRGAPCHYFNMCLRCPNVLIMEEHLPHLFAMRRQYLMALDRGLSNTPHRDAIQQNLHILNGLLDPEHSDWPTLTLEDAERRSEYIDLMVDPVALNGVV